MKQKVVINNIPSYALHPSNPFWVYRVAEDGENYFWGAFESEYHAKSAAKEIGGEVININD